MDEGEKLRDVERMIERKREIDSKKERKIANSKKQIERWRAIESVTSREQL